MHPKRQPLLRWDRQTMVVCLRVFLTPAVWRQMHATVPNWKTQAKRWELTTCVLTGIWWALLDGKTSFRKRFGAARETVAKMRPGRRAPGKTLSGFLQALGRLPYRSLVELRVALRARIGKVLGAGKVGRWEAYAVDGTRLILPRTAAQERAWKCSTKGEAPNVHVTALLNLGTGVLHDWRMGGLSSSERGHLRRLLPELPAGSLLVGDIGFCGFDLFKTMQARGQRFLIRVGSTTVLLREGAWGAAEGAERIWLWPGQKRGEAPLALRALRLEPTRHGPAVWLLTNVFSEEELTREEAESLYRARWGIEVDVFRGFKQTLGKAKLAGRTPVTVLREVELSLLALMLSQALGARAMVQAGRAPGSSSLSAVRDTLEAYGEKLRRGRRGWDFSRRLREALRDAYPRAKSKSSRRPIKIKEVRVPGEPKIRAIDAKLKAKMLQRLAEENAHAA